MEKKKNKVIIVLLILFILISLGLGGFIVYDKFISKKEINVGEVKQNKVESQDKNNNLTISSDLVKRLYSYVKSDGLFDQMLIEKVLEKNDEILASSLDQQTLNYYGYKQIKLSDTELKECQDYKNIKQSNYACGFNSYISETDGLNAESNETISFDEDILKNNVEMIFGKNTYKSTDYFEISLSQAFLYDSSLKQYVRAEAPAGGTGVIYEKKLKDVKENKDYLTLVENVSFDYTDYNVDMENLNKNILYNFKLDSENNYYLYSIDIEK